MRRADSSAYSCSRKLGVRGWGLPVCHLKQRVIHTQPVRAGCRCVEAVGAVLLSWPVAAGSVKPGMLLPDMLPGRLPGQLRRLQCSAGWCPATCCTYLNSSGAEGC